MSIIVAIVDGDRRTLDGLATLIRTTPGLHLGAACRSGHAALCELPVILPQVILFEPNLADLPGWAGVSRLRTAVPGALIVALSRQATDRTVQAAIAAGAHGFLPLSAPPARIIEAVAEVTDGGAPLTSRAARILVEQCHAGLTDAAVPAELTRREEEVLGGFAGGFRAKEVATWLHISLFTVQTHVRNIYSKLGVRSTAHAVARYYPLGRLPAPPVEKPFRNPPSAMPATPAAG